MRIVALFTPASRLAGRFRVLAVPAPRRTPRLLRRDGFGSHALIMQVQPRSRGRAARRPRIH